MKIAKFAELNVGILEDKNFSYESLCIMLTLIGKDNLVSCNVEKKLEMTDDNLPLTFVEANVIYFEEQNSDVVRDTIKSMQEIVKKSKDQEEVSRLMNEFKKDNYREI